jgi:hypothetical protein
MATPKFTTGGRSVDALIALTAKQPPPASAPAEPRGAQRAGNELRGTMSDESDSGYREVAVADLFRYANREPFPELGTRLTKPEPSKLGVRSEKRT